MELALGWASWKTYVGDPDTSLNRTNAIGILGGVLVATDPEAAISVLKTSIATVQRLRSVSDTGKAISILSDQGNLARCYGALKKRDEALAQHRTIYASHIRVHGRFSADTLKAGNHLLNALMQNSRHAEAKPFAREQLCRISRFARHFFRHLSIATHASRRAQKKSIKKARFTLILHRRTVRRDSANTRRKAQREPPGHPDVLLHSLHERHVPRRLARG